MHPLNDKTPITVTEFGMVMDCREVHPWKAPIVSRNISLLNESCCSVVLLIKVSLPILVIDFGIIIVFNEIHPINVSL